MRFLKPTKLRTLAQIIFFFLFLLLLVRIEFRGSLTASNSEIRLPYPVSFFFQLDPLVAISNALAGHALYCGLLWSPAVLIPTMYAVQYRNVGMARETMAAAGPGRGLEACGACESCLVTCRNTVQIGLKIAQLKAL